nr:hypothetical protein CFP56_41261 [Quercus suber]
MLNAICIEDKSWCFAITFQNTVAEKSIASRHKRGEGPVGRRVQFRDSDESAVSSHVDRADEFCLPN